MSLHPPGPRCYRARKWKEPFRGNRTARPAGRRLKLEALEPRCLLDGWGLMPGLEGGSALLAAGTVGPSVTDHDPDEVASDGGPLNNIRLTFDEPVDPASFSGADDVVLIDPMGFAVTPITVSAVTGSGDTQFDLSFSDRNARGQYALYVGPQITDVVGNPMNQDGDATNGEDPADKYTGTVIFPQIVASPPTGAPVLYAEDFEDWSTSPSDWSFYRDGGTVSAVDTGDPRGGTSHLLLDTPPFWKTTSAAWAVDLSSPAGQTDLWLKFWARRTSVTDVGQTYVQLAVADAEGLPQPVRTMLSFDPSEIYSQYTLDLDAQIAAAGIDLTTDGEVYVRFQYLSNNLNGKRDVFFDDVRIETGPIVSGPRVTAQEPLQVTADGGPLNNVRLTFDKTVDPASFTPSDVILIDPQGFQITPVAVASVAASATNHN